MYPILAMNITKNTLLMAAMTSLSMMGTIIIPMQSYGGFDSDENKTYDGNNSKTGSISQTGKMRSSHHMGQDNFCYMENETCIQANGSQEIMAKYNNEFGFNNQSIDVQHSLPQPPAQQLTQGPAPTILNICKEVINTGTIFDFEPSDFTFAFNTPASPVLFQGANEGCTAVAVAPGTYEFSERLPSFAENNGVGAIGDCTVRGSAANGVLLVGTIEAGETQTCTITNTLG
jgi:hypothetical protein